LPTLTCLCGGMCPLWKARRLQGSKAQRSHFSLSLCAF